MTGHLARLALRATRPVPGLRPRTPALFEQGARAWSLEPDPAQPDATQGAVTQPDATQPDATQRAVTQRASHFPDGTRPDLPRTDIESPETAPDPPRHPTANRPPAQVEPRGPATSSTTSPAGGPANPVVSFVSPAPAPTEPRTRRAHPVEPPARSTSWRPDGPDEVPQDRSNDRTGSPKAWTDLPALPTALPPSSAVLPTEHGPDPAALDRREDASEAAIGELRLRGALPDGTERLSAPLPRLLPQTDREPSRAPEVTVTIGRIEVLPAPRPAPPPPPVRAPARRRTNAPDLAAYLRDRGRR